MAEIYNVTGMHCAACSARVEKAVTALPGVESCSVSLLTNSMGVEGSASADEIIRAVEAAGYGASKRGATSSAGERRPGLAEQEEALRDRETPLLKKRLAYSLVFLAFLMYFSMGHTMAGFPLPAFFERNPIAVGLVQLLLCIAVMLINGQFFISGFRGLINRAPNMDTLVALGSAASFAWSVCVLFMMSDAALRGRAEAVSEYAHEFYFESAAMILSLITVGKMLEARSKGKTTDALKSLMKLSPKTARVIRGGAETEIAAEELRLGDVFVLRPGESVPADGIVIEGESAVNEAALTGESIPVDKAAGDRVSAATINQSGFLKCEATGVGEDTALSRIIKLMSDAAATKAPIAKIADRVSGVFVPAVIGIALLTSAVWLLLGAEPGYALARGISVLVISCPCALGLATPVAIMVGNGVGARSGILFKTAASLESTGRVKTVVLDKTGTVTKGEPEVTDYAPAEGESRESLLQTALLLEQNSEHPLAKAIMAAGEKLGLETDFADGFKALSGNGVSASYDGIALLGGSMKFMADKFEIGEAEKEAAERFSGEGKTPLAFSRGDKFIGIIAVADNLKEDSPRAISELKSLGINCVMLTGDNRRTAEAVGKRAGIDEVIAEVLPEGKQAAIKALQEKGAAAMVGDGINDAPALVQADVGIAIGAGTDIAIDAADVVLMKSRLSDVVSAVKLSRATIRTIYQGLFWAFIYNVIGIPLAAGVFTPLGLTLSPMFAAAAMSLSSFCVVTNALRLNFTKIS